MGRLKLKEVQKNFGEYARVITVLFIALKSQFGLLKYVELDIEKMCTSKILINHTLTVFQENLGNIKGYRILLCV